MTEKDVQGGSIMTNNCLYKDYIAGLRKNADNIFNKDSSIDLWDAAATYKHCADIIELLTSPPKIPLTLEEVKEMEGEPVWLHTFSSSKKSTRISQWAILELVSEASAMLVRAGCNSRLTKLLNDYGKTWVVYGRKPEEPLDQAVYEKKCVQVDKLAIIQKAKECLKGIKKYPVDVKEICKANNIELAFSDFESLEEGIGVKIDAILKKDSVRCCIMVNNLLPSAYARYAIGQCLGHFFLHEGEIKTFAVFKNDQAPEAMKGRLFANHLFMPRKHFYEAYHFLVIPTAESLAKVFEVPERAVRERITELGDPDLSVI